MKRLAAIALLALAGFSVGCANYYRVTDPTTGRVYYTQELQHQNSGAAKLKDARTGGTVTVQNSEIEKISEEQFNVGRYTVTAAGTQPTAR